MVRLRHLKSETLHGLERMVGKFKNNPIILGPPQKVKNHWYVHFLLQGDTEEKKPRKAIEKAQKTKTIKRSSL